MHDSLDDTCTGRFHIPGYSKDGGLYFPETIPKLSQEQLESWSKLSYPDLLTEILCLYIDPSELSREQITGEIMSGSVGLVTDTWFWFSFIHGSPAGYCLNLNVWDDTSLCKTFNC